MRKKESNNNNHRDKISSHLTVSVNSCLLVVAKAEALAGAAAVAVASSSTWPRNSLIWLMNMCPTAMMTKRQKKENPDEEATPHHATTGACPGANNARNGVKREQ